MPFSVYDVSEALRSRLARSRVHLAPAIDDMAVLRVVVRNGFSQDLAEIFLDDLKAVLNRLATSAGPNPGPTQEKASFPPLTQVSRSGHPGVIFRAANTPSF